jgi:hypothetical protein
MTKQATDFAPVMSAVTTRKPFESVVLEKAFTC